MTKTCALLFLLLSACGSAAAAQGSELAPGAASASDPTSATGVSNDEGKEKPMAANLDFNKFVGLVGTYGGSYEVVPPGTSGSPFHVNVALHGVEAHGEGPTAVDATAAALAALIAEFSAAAGSYNTIWGLILA